jgi:hypothetical protein
MIPKKKTLYPHPTQTIQFLDISNMTQDSNGITFYLNKLTKTDKPEKFRSVFIPVFTDNEKLCVNIPKIKF